MDGTARRSDPGACGSLAAGGRLHLRAGLREPRASDFELCLYLIALLL